MTARMTPRGSPAIFNDLAAAIAAGLGYGAMHTVVMYGAMIGTSAGEPAYYLPTCPRVNMFLWTGAFDRAPAARATRCLPTPRATTLPHAPARAAVVALYYNLAHIALTVIALEGWRRRSWWLLPAPLAAHLLLGLLVRCAVAAAPAVWATQPCHACTPHLRPPCPPCSHC